MSDSRDCVQSVDFTICFLDDEDPVSIGIGLMDVALEKAVVLISDPKAVPLDQFEY